MPYDSYWIFGIMRSNLLVLINVGFRKYIHYRLPDTCDKELNVISVQNAACYRATVNRDSVSRHITSSLSHLLIFVSLTLFIR